MELFIAPRLFQSKVSARLFFKNMICRYQENQAMNLEDNTILHSLIARHPESARKIGSGIKNFYKAKSETGTFCFWINRTDSSKTDFSYIACVSGRGPTLHSDFNKACRSAVMYDLMETKKWFFRAHGDDEEKIYCQLSREKISIKESHLDHKPPLTFEVIVKAFIAAHNIKICRSMFSDSTDGKSITEFVDSDKRESFRNYHHRIAQLRIISSHENIKLGAKHRIIPSILPVKIIKSM